MSGEEEVFFLSLIFYGTTGGRFHFLCSHVVNAEKNTVLTIPGGDVIAAVCSISIFLVPWIRER